MCVLTDDSLIIVSGRHITSQPSAKFTSVMSAYGMEDPDSFLKMTRTPFSKRAEDDKLTPANLHIEHLILG